MQLVKDKFNQFVQNRTQKWDQKNTPRNQWIESGPGQDRCPNCGKYLATLSPTQLVKDPKTNKIFCSENCLNFSAKPMESKSIEQEKPETTFTQVKFNPLNLCVEFLHDFQDKDELQDFIDSLDAQELSIIEKNKDNADELRKIRLTIKDDIEDTAKSLEMDG